MTSGEKLGDAIYAACFEDREKALALLEAIVYTARDLSISLDDYATCLVIMAERTMEDIEIRDAQVRAN